jgi:hypothetical protein
MRAIREWLGTGRSRARLWTALAPNRFQGFLAGVRTRNPLNVLDNVILMNEKPGSTGRPASSILTLKHQPRVPS